MSAPDHDLRAHYARRRRGEVDYRSFGPRLSWKRPATTIPVALLGAELLADSTGSAWAHNPRLALSRIVDPIPANPLGHAGPVIPPGWPKDHSGLWLRNAAGGLCVLAAAAAAVSFTAQYRLVDATRHLPVIAALEAAIPDTAALVFACLGIAVALQGRRAVRARVLNLAAVTASVFMNAIAAGPGWRDLAIWVMPPAAYALASDTLIGVIRASAVARHRQLGTSLAASGGAPLGAIGALVLWLLRLVIAPASTLAGFRTWVVEECPVAPGRRAPRLAPPPAEAVSGRGRAPVPRKATKTARFLDLVTERHGPLACIPLDATSRIASALAPQAGLNTGAARTALRKAVLTAQQDGDPR